MSKKILLTAINASFVHSNPAVFALRRSAAAALGDDCPVIELAEHTINDRYEDILFDLIERNADVIGISVYIWNAQIARQLLGDLRRLYPRGGKILFAGGPEAETRAEEYLESCDFVMRGEGEHPFSEFCRRLAKSAVTPEDINRENINTEDIKTTEKCTAITGIWEDLPGAVYREKEGTLRVVPILPDRGFEKNIPFLYDGNEDFEHRIIYYESSRGCPFRCSYCLSSEDKNVIFRDLQTVKKELTYFLDKKVSLVKFIDRTFNANRSRAREIWEFIRDNDNGITGFHFEIGADLLSEEDLELLQTLRPGLIQLEIGIQSTNEKTLDAIRRGADNAKIFHAVTGLMRSRNMALHTDLIVGLPFEDAVSFQKSFNDVYSLRADQFQVGFLKVLAGTEMERRAEEYGLVYSARPPYTVLATKWLTPQEIDLFRRIADMVEIFWNAGLFQHALPYLEKGFSSPYAMYEALAGYYRDKMGNKALSPRARGEFLKEFAESCAEKDGTAEIFAMETFSELLRFDERLHFHPSRRMTAEDIFRMADGEEKKIIFDYSRIHPVTREAFWSRE